MDNHETIEEYEQFLAPRLKLGESRTKSESKSERLDRENTCDVDMKFRRIKGMYPEIRCLALVEVQQAGTDKVREHLGVVMEHTDILCCSMEELAKVVRKVHVLESGGQ